MSDPVTRNDCDLYERCIVYQKRIEQLEADNKGHPDNRILRQERDTGYSLLKQCQKDHGKKDKRIERLQWDYDAACCALEVRDKEIEQLEAELEDYKFNHDESRGRI